MVHEKEKKVICISKMFSPLSTILLATIISKNQVEHEKRNRGKEPGKLEVAVSMTNNPVVMT